VTGRRGRRRKHLLDGLKETKRYMNSKGEALDRCVRGTRFGRISGPVARESTG